MSTFQAILLQAITAGKGGVCWCERSADVPGHYGGHPRPQVADRGTPSRVAQEGSTGQRRCHGPTVPRRRTTL